MATANLPPRSTPATALPRPAWPTRRGRATARRRNQDNGALPAAATAALSAAVAAALLVYAAAGSTRAFAAPLVASCPDGYLTCGASCYSASAFVCYDDAVLCPLGMAACGTVCYPTGAYHCDQAATTVALGAASVAAAEPTTSASPDTASAASATTDLLSAVSAAATTTSASIVTLSTRRKHRSSATSTTQTSATPSSTSTSAAPESVYSPASSTSSASSTQTASSLSFAGVNSYFIHTLSTSDQETLLDAIAAANYKAVRIFINHVYAGSKGTSAVGVNDLEQYTVGQYDDTVLNLVDDLMARCYSRGIKLIIALHDRYSLGTWDTDAYATAYGDSAFYTNSAAQAAMDARIAHILAHSNPNFSGRAWSDLSEVVLAFEPENESMGHMDLVNPDWTCSRATAIRAALPSGSAILVSTGGGTDAATSVRAGLLSCTAVDIIAQHSYGNDGAATLAAAATAAAAAGKRLLYEEFGNTGADKATLNAAEAAAANAAAVPWMAWEASLPSIYSDYEFWTDEPVWTALSSAAADARGIQSPWSWTF
ncbi:hypothetical protein HK405_014636 [Cladochytrium tenue]|nr:hypothetical protein HK405_014636 [Cladochytrium tenue]